MKLGPIPENLIERMLLKLGLLPTPLLDTQIAFSLAMTVMLGSKFEIFETLIAGPLTSEEIAQRCKIHPAATKKFLNALAGAGYLQFKDQTYALSKVARKWMLKDSPESLHDKMLFQFLEWDIVKQYEGFIDTGQPLSLHENTDKEMWDLYQRGMRSLASTSAPEVAKRTPIPKGARDMLDIGGSHGYYSVALCRRYPELRSVILDLPEAIAQAKPILAKENMGERVIHRAGNALTDDLGTEAWDLIFIAQLVHHFDEESNRALARRVAQALRPGGVFVIQEVIRPRSPNEAGQMGALLDLYFSATSRSGTWSVKEISSWQQEAGLKPQKPIWLRSLPGTAQQAAVKKG